MSDTNETATLDADAIHRIACELTHDARNFDNKNPDAWKNLIRWTNRGMMLAVNTITTQQHDLDALRADNATAQRYVSDANEEINALRAEVERLRVDAQRYHWLRNEHLRDQSPLMVVVCKQNLERENHEWCDIATPEELDKIIDEAMKGEA